MVLQSFDQVQVKGMQKRRWSDGLEPYKWVKGWQRIRIFGGIYTDARHTIKTKSGKFYTENCLAYDWQNDRFLENRADHCEDCRMKVPVSVRHYANVFSLDAWEKMPRNPPPDWTCIFMADLPPSLVKSIFDLKPLNNNFPISDALKGALLNIKFDPQADSPANMYYAAVGTANWAFEPEMLNLTLVQEMDDGRRTVHKGTDKLPPQWVYIRGSVPSLQEQKDSLRRNGYYGEETADTNPEAAGHARDLLKGLEEVDVGDSTPPAPRPSSVKNLAVLRDDTPDEAPPPRPQARSPEEERKAQVAEGRKLAKDEEEVEIPF